MGYLACFAFIFKSVKSFPKDERIQILLEYFEMIQNLQDTCCNLARYQRKKTSKINLKARFKILRESDSRFKILREFDPDSKFLIQIQNLARIWQQSWEFLISGKLFLIILGT